MHSHSSNPYYFTWKCDTCGKVNKQHKRLFKKADSAHLIAMRKSAAEASARFHKGER